MSSDNTNGVDTSDPPEGTGKPVEQGNQKKSFFSRFKPGNGNNEPAEDKPPPPPRVKFHELFRYASLQERFYVLISVIAAMIHGSLLPLFSVIFGQLITEFATDEGQPLDFNSLVDAVGDRAKWFLVLAAVAFVSSSIQVRFQLVVAQRICARLRQMFFKSIMSQDFTWYDGKDGGDLTAHVANDVNVIQSGIGDKVTTAVQFISTFFVGIVIAFVYGPLLTLVVLAVAPLLMIGGAVFAKLAADSTGDGLGAYGSAGAVATEVIALIRVVTAYNGQQSEIDRYSIHLNKAYRAHINKAVSSGLGLGVTMFIIFCSYSIAFTFGAQQVRDGKMEVGDILTTFFAVIIACVSIGQAAPSFQAFASAQGAAPAIFDIIERKSEINPLDEEDGDTIPDFKGHIAFNNVDFSYKRAPDATIEMENEPRSLVLSKFSMEAPPGTSHALVGPSGCGKSTTVRLVERFYDVDNGTVLLDGVDVRTLNVRWLRSQMGYVGQMPTLFMLSIRENIALGAAMEVSVDEKKGTKVLRRREVTDDEIIDAAKMANAHDFIMKLPEQYDTMLGERGALLSGGQKQRVCIARALIRNPKILILDESTAALDAQSERIVQQALEKAAAGRTTITIAHRLSTVRNADVISVIDEGVIVEAGKHDELMKLDNGAYRKLVEHQNIEALKNKDMLTKKEGEGGESAKAQVANSSVTKTKTSGAIELNDDGETKEEAPDVDPGVLKRAFLMNAKEGLFILLGTIGGAMAGSAFPLSAILFSEAISTIADAAKNTVSGVRRYALLYIAIGGVAFLGNFMQLTFLGISGERLTRKLRLLCFKAILRQEMGFFDEKENALGALTTRLAMDASLVEGVTGNTLGGFAFVAGTILTGFLVSYLACWKVALVVTAMFPFMAIAGALQVKMMTGFDSDSDKKYMTAGAVASEAVDNFETVTASGVQDVFIKRYNTELDIPVVNGRQTALIAGLAFGVAEAFSFALWAVSFWVGSIFVKDDGGCSFPDLMKAITGLLFGGMMLGQVSTYLPDVTKSKIAATKVFRLLDRATAIDPTVEGGSKGPIEGEVELDKVTFEYPTRPDVPVLRGLSVGVGKGKTLALVGASGCGKSTVVALLERFYDPRTGEVRFDGSELKDYNLEWVRKHMGLVSQEPDLFNRSIRDNIAYGLGHEEGTVVTDEMIEAAAKAANVHSFVTDMTEGYDTIVGQRGSRLSGGQRQRVAIARAIVGEPKLLLLDEATSALDAVSERLVQDALDRVGAGRTTVAIAHRLSTVKDADAIAVVSRGKIVEVGTHDQLLRIEGGEYANLVKNQLASGDGSSSQS